MTTKNICLLQSKYAESTQTTQTLLSSASARVIIDKFSASNNTASSATFTASIVASGGTASADEVVLPTRNIAPGECYHCPELVGHVLQPGDFISLIAGTGNAIVIRAAGREIL